MVCVYVILRSLLQLCRMLDFCIKLCNLTLQLSNLHLCQTDMIPDLFYLHVAMAPVKAATLDASHFVLKHNFIYTDLVILKKISRKCEQTTNNSLWNLNVKYDINLTSALTDRFCYLDMCIVKMSLKEYTDSKRC